MEALGRAEFDWRNLREGSPFRSYPRIEPAFLLRWLAVFLVAALFLCGAWLMVRRLTGSFASPLGDGALLATGALAVLWAAAARLVARHAAHAPNRSWQQRVMEWTPTGALVLIATAAVLPGSSLAAVVLLWTMIAAEEIAEVMIARRPRSVRSSIAVALVPSVRSRTKQRPACKNAAKTNVSRSSNLWQQQTRERTAGGQEAIHGLLRAAFSLGQRTTIEHVVFCPMLDGVPRFTATALDELDCTARATHVYRYGARLEIKLREPCDEPVEILVQYEAQCQRS